MFITVALITIIVTEIAVYESAVREGRCSDSSNTRGVIAVTRRHVGGIFNVNKK